MQILYELAVRLSLSTAGIAAGAYAAIRAFRSIQSEVSTTERALVAANTRLARMTFMGQTNTKGYGWATLQQKEALDAQTAAQAKLNDATAGYGKVAAGVGLFAVGVAGLKVVDKWVSAARQMQDALVGVGLAAKGTQAQLDSIERASYTIASKTQFSAPQVLDMAKLAATGGVNSRTNLLAMLPTLANAAEVAYRLKGTPYTESVPSFVRIAHQFQQWGGPKFNDILDLVGRAQVVSGDTPANLQRTLSYLGPAISSFNYTPEEAISLAALASNVGISNARMGGSKMQAVFRGLVPTLTRRGAVHNEMLRIFAARGGGDFFDAQGQASDPLNVFEVVMRTMASISSQKARLQLLNTTFGAAGASALAVLAQPGTVARFRDVRHLLAPGGGIVSTAEMQKQLNATMTGQMITLNTNMASLNAILGKSLVPALVKVLNLLVLITGQITQFALAHPLLTKVVAIFVALAAALAVIAGPILAVAGALQILAAAGVTVDLAFAPVLLTIAAVTVAVVGVTLLFTHWGEVTKTLGGVFGFLGDKVAGFLRYLGILKGQTPRGAPRGETGAQAAAREQATAYADATKYATAYNRAYAMPHPATEGALGSNQAAAYLAWQQRLAGLVVPMDVQKAANISVHWDDKTKKMVVDMVGALPPPPTGPASPATARARVPATSFVPSGPPPGGWARFGGLPTGTPTPPPRVTGTPTASGNPAARAAADEQQRIARLLAPNPALMNRGLLPPGGLWPTPGTPTPIPAGSTPVPTGVTPIVVVAGVPGATVPRAATSPGGGSPVLGMPGSGATALAPNVVVHHHHHNTIAPGAIVVHAKDNATAKETADEVLGHILRSLHFQNNFGSAVPVGLNPGPGGY